MAKPTYYGVTMPFVSPAGILPFQADERIIKNDLLILLLTAPGQRVMRPGFGTPINRYLFEPADQNDYGTLRSAILLAIEVNEPRVIVEDVVINGNENQLDIKVIFRLTFNPTKTLNIDLELPRVGAA